jgi:hypothetical protein
MILTRIKEMKKNLDGRWAPRGYSAASSTTASDVHHAESRSKLHNRLESCLLHMFIGRPFILAHRRVQETTQCGHTDAVKDVILSKSATPNGQWDFLIHDSVSAANEVINICHDMRVRGMGLAKSSYAEYSSCRASLLVLIAHSVCCRTNEHSRTLREGLDAIREMASVGESAQSEVSLLETLEGALERLHAFDEPRDESQTTMTKNNTQDGYEGLLTWYTRMAQPSRSCASDSTISANDPQNTRVPNLASVHSTPNKIYQPITNTSIDQLTDQYPFDFDLLNADGNTALFTPNFHGLSNTENELFENLLWPPV